MIVIAKSGVRAQLVAEVVDDGCSDAGGVDGEVGVLCQWLLAEARFECLGQVGVGGVEREAVMAADPVDGLIAVVVLDERERGGVVGLSGVEAEGVVRHYQPPGKSGLSRGSTAARMCS